MFRTPPAFHLMDAARDETIPPKPAGRVRILQFSDLHIGIHPALADLLYTKRILGYFNHLFRRRRRIHAEYIQRLAERLPEIQPDAVLCTGDLSSIGLASEFEAAEELLQPFRRHNLLFIPGNHDRYVQDPAALDGLKELFRRLNPPGLELDALPAIQNVKGLAIILLNPARPVPYHLSCGVLDSAMQAKMDALLASLPKQAPRIVASHFPALTPKGGLAGWRHGLRGAEYLAEKLGNGQVDAILSGHEHHPYAARGPNGNLQLCVGSLTLAASYGICDF